MESSTTHEKLLVAGQRLMLERGYHDTGIQDVLAAVGVPKGSFYHHFASKEDFGLQVLDRFAGESLATLDRHLAVRSRSPLERLRQFFEAGARDYQACGFSNGCLLGMLGQELADTHEGFRNRVGRHLDQLARRIAEALEEAELPSADASEIDRLALAATLLDAWQGALLRMKVTKSSAPLDAFLRFQIGALEALR